jgi:hypothetical protein
MQSPKLTGKREVKQNLQNFSNQILIQHLLGYLERNFDKLGDKFSAAISLKTVERAELKMLIRAPRMHYVSSSEKRTYHGLDTALTQGCVDCQQEEQCSGF